MPPSKIIRRNMPLKHPPLEYELRRASIIQSYTLSIAAIVGGTWALYSYIALGQSERARLEISELREKHPNLDIAIETNMLGVDQEEEKMKNLPAVVITVIIKNLGSAPQNIWAGESYVSVHKLLSIPSSRSDNISRTGTNIPTYSEGPALGPISDPNNETSTVVAQPKSSQRLKYVFQPSSRGIYSASFTAYARGSTVGTALVFRPNEGSLQDAKQQLFWSATEVFRVVR